LAEGGIPPAQRVTKKKKSNRKSLKAKKNKEVKEDHGRGGIISSIWGRVKKS